MRRMTSLPYDWYPGRKRCVLNRGRLLYFVRPPLPTQGEATLFPSAGAPEILIGLFAAHLVNCFGRSATGCFIFRLAFWNNLTNSVGLVFNSLDLAQAI